MSGVWGKNVKFSIFGESHGKAVGITIDGLKPGIELDLSKINLEMDRRAPGRNGLSTPRKEEDNFQILSGFFNGKTTGTPLCAVIFNSDQHSRDYEKTKNLMRPSHGDLTGHYKYKGFNDYRGGGHFSGRLTAPIVFAGAVCTQILESKGIVIGAHIKSIYNMKDKSFGLDINENTLKGLKKSSFPVLDKNLGDEMEKAIIKAKEEMDSVGGVVECAAVNIPPGVGEPFFDSLESSLSHLLFSIPGVKGVEFGAGFEISTMKGSEANDGYYMEGEKVKTFSNNNGGIAGGITTGMPVLFRAAFKPTPSIGKIQKTVDIETGKDAFLEIKGRHDPCIVIRAVPVVEAVTAMALLDNIL